MSAKHDRSDLVFGVFLFIIVPGALVILAPTIADALTALERELFGAINLETGTVRPGVSDAGVIFVGMWLLLFATAVGAETSGRTQGYRQGREAGQASAHSEVLRELSQVQNRERQAREAKERRDEIIDGLHQEIRALKRHVNELKRDLLRSPERGDD